MTDKDQYKSQIKRYLTLKGWKVKDTAHPPVCECPTHNDENPSAIIYEDWTDQQPGVWCPLCLTKWDIFEFSKQINGFSDFKDALKDVKQTLGDYSGDIKSEFEKTETYKKSEFKKVTIEPIEIYKAKNIFTQPEFLRMSEFIGKKSGEKKGLTLQGVEAQKYGYGDKITGNWLYKNDDGLIEAIDVRFEGGPKKKNVVTFYYDGKHLKSKSAPVKIYNRDLIKKYPNYTILIVEGAKSAKIAMCLLEFGLLPVAWNGGTHKITMADWSCVYNRDVLYFPDDDDPGIKAAETFGKEYGALIDDWKIVPPYQKAKRLKQHGADIEEVLQLLSPKECAEYITNSEPYKKPEPLRNQSDGSKREEPPALEGKDPPNPTSHAAFSDAPFRILGTAEDGYTYFIDQHGRIYTTKLDCLSRNKLNALAPLSYWEEWIGTNRLTNDDWARCQDDIIRISGAYDFDPEDIRGRGAWREENGDICFHTGQKTIGKYSPDKIFLRKKAIKIGIEEKPLEYETILKMGKAAFNLTFETPVDAMRCLGWAVLAPFSGALIWRPQAFLTGPSESGKSSIETYILKKISIAKRMIGASTTAAGYMQSRKGDVGAIHFDEAEDDTESKEKNKQDLLSIMRQSTSDDTPKSYKGTSDQKGISYTSRDMIMFVAISPEVGSVADDNRLTRINIVKPVINEESRKWSEIKEELESLFTEKNCQRLRALVWSKLEDIIELSNKISDEIQDYTKKNHRFAISEGTIMAAYLLIWKGMENPTKEEIKSFVEKTYEKAKPEDSRDQSEEILETIYQEKTKIYLNGHMTELPIGDIIGILMSEKIETSENGNMGSERDLTKEEIFEYRRAIEVNGVYVQDKKLAIANNHKEIKRILRRNSGYSRILRRHPKCIKTDHTVTRGKSRKCSLFDVIDDFIPF